MTPQHEQPFVRDEEDLAWRLDWNLLRSFMVIMDVGSITEAARQAGLSRGHLHRRLRELGCDAQAARDAGRSGGTPEPASD